MNFSGGFRMPKFVVRRCSFVVGFVWDFAIPLFPVCAGALFVVRGCWFVVGFVWYLGFHGDGELGAEINELLQCAVVLPGDGGLVAQVKLQGFGVISQGLESEGKAAGLIELLESFFDLRCLGVHFEVEEGGLGAGKAFQAHGAGRHLLDEPQFDIVGGLQAREKVLEDFLEFFAVLVGVRDGRCSGTNAVFLRA
jgi:hypothetical protein